MKIESVFLNVCFAVLAVGFTGCTSTASSLRAESRTSALEFKFVEPSAEQDLAKIGLMATFKSYWQSHRDRNWSLRFSLENLKQNLSEKFYVAYYDKAWTLKTVSVRSVTPGNQSTGITLALTLINPETTKETLFESIEMWTLVEGRWVHEVSDPLLTGTK